MKKLICCLVVSYLVLLIGKELKHLAVDATGRGGGIPSAQNGDINGDGARDISDAISLLNWLFSGGPEPVACAGGNPDLEGRVDALEAIVHGCFNFVDNNNDSVPDCAQPDLDSDRDGFSRQDDCDDADATVFPGAVEVCDRRDNDCNGQVDENVDLSSDVNNCGDCGRSCQQGEVCQDGGCVRLGQCPPGSDGQSCDDGNLCTIDDLCLGGQCIGTPRNCDDGNPCTVDTCDFASGLCSSTNVPNGQNCGGGRLCVNGQCVLQDADQDGFSPPQDCDDTNAAINPARPENCSDGLDNDCDGAVDAADSGC